MLGKATGTPKYFDYLNTVYWAVTDHLFDKRYGLFYRDAGYFDAKTARGKKVFWSRGNGWVLGGIPRVLQYLPKENEHYDRYVELFRTMSAAMPSGRVTMACGAATLKIPCSARTLRPVVLRSSAMRLHGE